MKILVLQHAAVEHPGIFRDFLSEDGHEWHAVKLDEGETAPPLDGFDALWVMGGPMDVWQEDKHPWLKDEKRLIQDAVEQRVHKRQRSVFCRSCKQKRACRALFSMDCL